MLHIALISPDKKVWEGDADAVTVPTSTGHIQILNHHVPLVSALQAGEVVVRVGGELHAFAVSAGLVEVRPGNHVIILANSAEAAIEIDVERAEAARARARGLLTEKINSAEEYAAVMAMVDKQFARIKVAVKYKHRRG